MFSFSFCADLFADGGTAYSDAGLAQALWLLVFADEVELRSDRSHPLLYGSGIRWQAEQPRPGFTPCRGSNGAEVFGGVQNVLDDGHADCEDVAAWRVAELRIGKAPSTHRGPPPRPGHPAVTVCPPPRPPVRLDQAGQITELYTLRPAVNVLPAFYRRPHGNGWLYHIVVAWPDGFIEDPSRALGMGGYG